MALGQRLFVHHVFGRGIVGLIAVVAIVLLMRFWPRDHQMVGAPLTPPMSSQKPAVCAGKWGSGVPSERSA